MFNVISKCHDDIKNRKLLTSPWHHDLPTILQHTLPRGIYYTVSSISLTCMCEIQLFAVPKEEHVKALPTEYKEAFLLLLLDLFCLGFEQATDELRFNGVVFSSFGAFICGLLLLLRDSEDGGADECLDKGE